MQPSCQQPLSNVAQQQIPVLSILVAQGPITQDPWGGKIGCHLVRVVTSGLGEDSYWETSFGWIHTGNYFGYIVISFHSLRPRDTSRVLPVDWTVCPVTLVAEPTKGSRCQQRAKPAYWAD